MHCMRLHVKTQVYSVVYGIRSVFLIGAVI
jgi:hypothetical protein